MEIGTVLFAFNEDGEKKVNIDKNIIDKNLIDRINYFLEQFNTLEKIKNFVKASGNINKRRFQFNDDFYKYELQLYPYENWNSRIIIKIK